MDLPTLRWRFFNRATVREELIAGLVPGIQSMFMSVQATSAMALLCYQQRGMAL